MAPPKFQTLVTHLEEGIASGRYPRGQRLPPQRDLATQFGVTIATVTRVIQEASRRGLVVARPGSGTFVREIAEPAAMQADPAAAIDLRLNSVPMTPGIRAALADAMAVLGRAGRPEALFGYHPPAGAPHHREAAARWLRPRGLEARGDALLLAHGAQHAMSACLAALTRPGDTVLCEAWTYYGFRRLAAAAGLRLAPVAMDGEGMLPEDLARQLAATGASLVMCSPAVQNPTMATMSAGRRQDILAACRGTAALLLEDDVYGHLAADPSPPLAALDPDRCVYVTGLSKAIAPGLRLGIIQAPGRVRAALVEALSLQHWTAPALQAELLARLVDSGATTICRREHQAEMQRRLGIVAAALGPGRFGAPSLPSYHVWLPVPAPWMLEDFIRALDRRGVRVLPATHFAVGGMMPPPHIRACIGVAEPAALERAFAVIAEVQAEQPWSLDAVT